MTSPYFYLTPEGYTVFTAAHHLQRGYCCGCGCRHCPYDYEAVPEPRRSELLQPHEEKSNEPDR